MDNIGKFRRDRKSRASRPAFHTLDDRLERSASRIACIFDRRRQRPWKRHGRAAVPIARGGPWAYVPNKGWEEADRRVEHERLEAALEAAGLGVCEWDLVRNVLTISPAAAALTGVPAGEHPADGGMA